MQIFLQNQTIQREQTSIFNTLAYRTFLPDWAKSETIYRSNGNIVLLTPVSRNELFYIRRLHTEFDANNNILSSSIVELLTLDENTAQRQNAILKDLQDYPQNDFSGYVYQYDLAYNLLSEYQSANNICSDWGQDVPFNPNAFEYNGVKIEQNYKNAQGKTIKVDTNIINAFKFVIDNQTYRTIISSYLPPNSDKLTISFDVNAVGGYFDTNTNTIYINPEQLQSIGMLDMVNILVHESIHAMFFKPNSTIQAQLNNAAATLANHYSNPAATTNMIHHEAMGQYYKSEVISILKSFHESSLGVVQNAINITDTHFEGIFLYSLINVQYPEQSAAFIILANLMGKIRSFRYGLLSKLMKLEKFM